MKTFHFEPKHEAAARVRQELRRLCEASVLSSQLSADLELVVAELTSNAVEQGPTEPVRLDVTLNSDLVRVTVANAGSGFDLSSNPTSLPDNGVLTDRGRGLHIIEALTDSLWVEQSDGWTTVGCILRFDPVTD